MRLYSPFPHAAAFAFAAKDMGELDAILRSSTVVTLQADALRSQLFRGSPADVHINAMAALESFLWPSEAESWSVDTLRAVLGGVDVREGLWRTPAGGHDASRLMAALTALATRKPAAGQSAGASQPQQVMVNVSTKGDLEGVAIED